jgi:hypothetical protein
MEDQEQCTSLQISTNDACRALATTSAAFLVQAAWLSSDDQLPDFIPVPVTPTRKHHHALLNRATETPVEETYQEALCQSYSREEAMKANLIRTQSAMVLQSIYCTRVRGQLAAQEEKEHTGKVKKAKLMGDGMPKYLSGDEFYNCVAENEKKVAEAEKSREDQWKKCEEWAETLVMW